MARSPWWRGTRGEWYVAAQFALFALVLFGPHTRAELPTWTPFWTSLASGAAAVLGATGLLSCAAGAAQLGTHLTPLPHPTDDATLVETGIFRLVRHPIYSGVIALAFAWALWRQGWLTLGYAALLFCFFDLKSRREERWLCVKFPAYPAYRRQVCRLIPFLY
jgi:protein-S-isoprenylcysteine O-methyltransferase Ste14